MLKTKLKINENSITFYGKSSFNEEYFKEIAKKHNLDYKLKEEETKPTIYSCKLTRKMIDSEIADLYLALMEIVKEMRQEYGDDGNTGTVEFI